MNLKCSSFRRRYVFWIDNGEQPHIGRIGMDGTDRLVFSSTEMSNPTALTIDYTTKRIYWADSNHLLFSNMEASKAHKGTGHKDVIMFAL